jgi:hypothetical protein
MKTHIWMLAKDIHDCTLPNRRMVWLTRNSRVFFNIDASEHQVASKRPNGLEEKRAACPCLTEFTHLPMVQTKQPHCRP